MFPLLIQGHKLFVLFAFISCFNAHALSELKIPQTALNYASQVDPRL